MGCPLSAKSTTQGGRRTVEIVTGSLVSQIRAGRFSVGTMLPTERELCEMYDTSRPTVREAIGRLQYMGYLEAEAGKRPRIAMPSLESVLLSTSQSVQGLFSEAEAAAHLEQMRQFIEVGAVRIAANDANALQIARIQQRLEENWQAVGTADFPETDIAFHQAIVEVVGNPVLIAVSEMFRRQMLARTDRKSDSKAQDQMVCREHSEIFEALVKGEEITATEAMDRHLDRSYRDRLAESVALDRH